MLVSLTIQDSYYDQLLAFIKTLPKGAAQIEEDDGISFEEAKQRVAEAVESYRDGSATLYNEEAYQDRMDDFRKTLKAKDANRSA